MPKNRINNRSISVFLNVGQFGQFWGHMNSGGNTNRGLLIMKID